MNKIIINRERQRALCSNFIPLPNPKANDQDMEFGGCEQLISDQFGIIHGFLNSNLHTFRIFANEDAVYQRKQEQGIRSERFILSTN